MCRVTFMKAENARLGQLGELTAVIVIELLARQQTQTPLRCNNKQLLLNILYGRLARISESEVLSERKVSVINRKSRLQRLPGPARS